MGGPRPPTSDRWMHLLHLAEEMRAREGALSLAEVQLYLGSVEEAFAERSEPVEDFAAYALRRFCRQLGESLACSGEQRSIDS